MPILWSDIEHVVEEIRDDVRQVRALREHAYRLAMLARGTCEYGPDLNSEFTAAVDAVLSHFNLAKEQP